MQKDFYVVVDNIRSLENIGSIFRTADGAGVTKIFLCGISGKPPHHKIAKTALGAQEIIPFEYHKQTWRVLEKLKKEGVHILVLEQTKKSTLYINTKVRFPLALVIGNEVKGVSKSALKLADSAMHLPMHGVKESLNVSVAFGVAAYYLDMVRT